MLYVTTRNKHDAYTVARVLKPGRAPDGGFYQPYHLPELSTEMLDQLQKKSFSHCVADLLNLFFPCRLTNWDVEFCVGRYPVRITYIGSKILIAETWHNLEERYSRLEKALREKICTDASLDETPSWVAIAIRIAVLFGIFGELSRSGAVGPEKPIDISVPTGDFSVAMSVWYGRKMGLPIGNIICSCNENSGVWDLLHLGQLNTGAVAVKTASPEADFVVPEHLERLIFNTLGVDETLRFCECCRRGGIYAPAKENEDVLREGMYAAVVSQGRMASVISNVERTTHYILGPYEALAYSGLMDYRTKTGETRGALLISERSPSCDSELVAAALQITQQELWEKLR